MVMPKKAPRIDTSAIKELRTLARMISSVALDPELEQIGSLQEMRVQSQAKLDSIGSEIIKIEDRLRACDAECAKRKKEADGYVEKAYEHSVKIVDEAKAQAAVIVATGTATAAAKAHGAEDIIRDAEIKAADILRHAKHQAESDEAVAVAARDEYADLQHKIADTRAAIENTRSRHQSIEDEIKSLLDRVSGR